MGVYVKGVVHRRDALLWNMSAKGWSKMFVKNFYMNKIYELYCYIHSGISKSYFFAFVSNVHKYIRKYFPKYFRNI